MKKISLSLFIVSFLLLSLTTFAQTVHHKKTISSYQLKLAHVIDNLKADSVKIYSFSCGVLIKPPPGIMLEVVEGPQPTPERLIDSTQHFAFTLADSGKLVKPDDIKGILRTIKYEYLDTIVQPKPIWIKGKLVRHILLNEPTGCYEPRMGIMFFKDGIVHAHVDVCLTCGKLVFEQFNKGHVSYRYDCVVLGPKMEPYFSALCVNYKLLCCNSDH